jgi:hypothetical protein
LKEAAACTGHQVWVEVDNKSALIVGNPKGILHHAAPTVQASSNPLIKYYHYIN